METLIEQLATYLVYLLIALAPILLSILIIIGKYLGAYIEIKFDKWLYTKFNIKTPLVYMIQELQKVGHEN